MDLLQMLDGMSPWWWVIVAFALGSIEMATMSFFLIWLSLAAFCMAGLLLLAPDMSGTMQISIFAILSVVLTFAGRFLLHKFGDGGAENDSTLNSRSAKLVGRTASVLEFTAGKGVVEIEGMRWRAQWDNDQTAAAGDQVRITKADAMVLFVDNAV